MRALMSLALRATWATRHEEVGNSLGGIEEHSLLRVPAANFGSYLVAKVL